LFRNDWSHFERLGVRCNFCHVQQGKDPTTGSTKWVWESDDKPQKQTARRMMQMVSDQSE